MLLSGTGSRDGITDVQRMSIASLSALDLKSAVRDILKPEINSLIGAGAFRTTYITGCQ